MKYRLDHQVIFDPDAGTLNSTRHGNDPIAISNPTKRLLLLLIAHQGDAVSRDLIFKKVWDDFGMISSNNNLNQCISKLRRVLKTLGLEQDAIITVPKLGFMWHENIRVEPLPEASPGTSRPAIPAAAAPPPKKEPTPPTTPAAPARRSIMRLRSLLPLLLLLLCTGLLAGGAVLYHEQQHRAARIELYIGQAGTCQVLVSQNVLQDRDPALLQNGLLDYARRLDPHCNSGEYLLVIRSEAIKSWVSDLARFYFMRCGNLRESKAEVCWSLTAPPKPLP
ncbi:winged helix-turn-helix domain-containing protein [Pantoea sp. 1.19]|uniref:winged helix-turn-helix domain-containing protein n=1 Tax=Pantoea sp. 1.19 TaxID=1925589 RepID=UPI00094893A6|nr:winged helix-turn-helix domain-containing protein [Pantoea sp. 1.19]